MQPVPPVPCASYTSQFAVTTHIEPHTALLDAAAALVTRVTVTKFATSYNCIEPLLNIIQQVQRTGRAET